MARRGLALVLKAVEGQERDVHAAVGEELHHALRRVISAKPDQEHAYGTPSILRLRVVLTVPFPEVLYLLYALLSRPVGYVLG